MGQAIAADNRAVTDASAPRARPRGFAPLFWIALALPAATMLATAPDLGPDALEALLHPTGEFSARLLIAALALTPLTRLLPGSRPLAWLVRQRRAIGLAAFAYALLHLAVYVAALGLADMLAELTAPGIWTGWLALALLLPLAATSTDAAMRALGRGWKRLQRLAYPAALLTLAHWALVHNDLAAALLHFVPLALLELTRFLPTNPRTPA